MFFFFAVSLFSSSDQLNMSVWCGWAAKDGPVLR